MIDIRKIKEDPQKVIELFARKEKDASQEVAKILELDELRRTLIQKTESMKSEQNKVSKQIPAMKKAGEDVAPVFAKMKELANEIKNIEAELEKVEIEYRNYMLSLPNLPDEDLLGGGKENNQEIRLFGEPHKFDFEPKNHVDLCTDLGLIDYPRGTKLSGSGFWIYRGWGARLEWALLNYFVDTHIADGYEL
ncbi:MAG: serine--tRNA ligase, partial [Clostridia bacterium]|nr:serine--tRNA ligase [Clostridia bacterium]